MLDYLLLPRCSPTCGGSSMSYSCSGMGEIWIQIWSLKSKFSFIFLSTIWRLDALKIIEKIILENILEQKKKRPGLELNAGLAALICLWTTGPSLYPFIYLLPIKFPFKLIHKLSFYELKISEGLRFEVGNKLMYNFKMQFFSAPAIPVSIQSIKTILYTVPCWNFFSLSLSGEGLGPARRASISCQHFKYKKQKRLTYKYDVWEETVRALCKNISSMPSHPLILPSQIQKKAWCLSEF